jgi:hypothetical protein
MRPISILGFSAVLAIATLVSPARAEEEHFDLAVSTGQIKVTPKAGWHINLDYSWAIKKGSDKVKTKDDFKLDKASATVTGVPAGTVTVRGAVCSENACAPFTKDNVSVP